MKPTSPRPTHPSSVPGSTILPVILFSTQEDVAMRFNKFMIVLLTLVLALSVAQVGMAKERGPAVRR